MTNEINAHIVSVLFWFRGRWVKEIVLKFYSGAGSMVERMEQADALGMRQSPP